MNDQIAPPQASTPTAVIRPFHESGWLMVYACREFLQHQCKRSVCKFAHPSPGTEIVQRRVTICFDNIKNECTRVGCKYYHPPLHIKKAVLLRGKRRLEQKKHILVELDQELQSQNLLIGGFRSMTPLLQPLLSDPVSQQQLQYAALLRNPLGYFPTQLMVYPLAYGLPAVGMSASQYQSTPTSFPNPPPPPKQTLREYPHKKRALKDKDTSNSNDWTKHQHWRSPKKERVPSSPIKEATYDGTSWDAPPVQYGTVSSIPGCSNPTSFYPSY